MCENNRSKIYEDLRTLSASASTRSQCMIKGWPWHTQYWISNYGHIEHHIETPVNQLRSAKYQPQATSQPPIPTTTSFVPCLGVSKAPNIISLFFYDKSRSLLYNKPRSLTLRSDILRYSHTAPTHGYLGESVKSVCS